MSDRQWALIEGALILNVLIWVGVLSVLIARAFPDAAVLYAWELVGNNGMGMAESTEVLSTVPMPTVTPTLTSTVAVTVTPTPTAVVWQVPTRVPDLPLPEGLEVIAVLGTDTLWSAGRSWRTDVIILVMIDREAQRVVLFSVPRDLWVYIPGYGYNRVNTVDYVGEQQGTFKGFALLDQTLRYNLGIPVHHGVRVDFSGFVQVVDLLGGVTVDVPYALHDRFPDPLAPDGWRELDLEPGVQKMDGATALAYCRSRHTTSDFSRSQRQQQVIRALLQQALTPELVLKLPELWDVVGSSLQTDMDMGHIVDLAWFGVGLPDGAVQSAFIDEHLTVPWTTPQGAMVLLPKTEKIRSYVTGLWAETGE